MDLANYHALGEDCLSLLRRKVCIRPNTLTGVFLAVRVRSRALSKAMVALAHPFADWAVHLGGAEVVSLPEHWMVRSTGSIDIRHRDLGAP